MNNKLEMGIKILDAMDSGDLTLLEELFQNKERNIMESNSCRALELVA